MHYQLRDILCQSFSIVFMKNLFRFLKVIENIYISHLIPESQRPHLFRPAGPAISARILCHLNENYFQISENTE